MSVLTGQGPSTLAHIANNKLKMHTHDKLFLQTLCVVAKQFSGFGATESHV